MDESRHVIVHYGKLGMHWGVRLYQNKDGSLTPLGKQRYGKGKGNKNNSAVKTVTIKAKKLFSVVSKKVKKGVSSVAEKVSERHKMKNPETMTDEELKTVVNRLQMEKRYRDLMNERAEANTGVGRKLVKKLLAKSGDAAVDALVQGPIRKRFDNLFANLNPKDKPGNNSNNNSNNNNQQNSANNSSSTSSDANSTGTGGGGSGNQSSRRRNRNQQNAPTE